ncbi:hypothetical protein D3C85_1698860 [compost metagenome]
MRDRANYHVVEAIADHSEGNAISSTFDDQVFDIGGHRVHECRAIRMKMNSVESLVLLLDDPPV